MAAIEPVRDKTAGHIARECRRRRRHAARLHERDQRPEMGDRRGETDKREDDELAGERHAPLLGARAALVDRNLILTIRPDDAAMDDHRHAAGAASRAGGTGRRFRRDAAGAAAVEFALVSMPFITLIFCIIQMSLDFLFFSQVDYATHKAAQAIRSGAVQRAGMSEATFRTTILCPQLRMVDCADVKLNVARIRASADWSGAIADPMTTGQWRWCPSGSRDVVLVQAFYPMPFFSVTWAGQSAANPRRYKTAIAMRNDPFGLPAPSGPGC